MPTKSNLKEIGGILLVFIVGVAAFSWPHFFVRSPSPSLGYYLFFNLRTNRDIRKGDYVVFNMSSKYINGGKPESLLKEVSCVEGDMLERRGREYLCNGVFLGRAKECSLKGVRLDNFLYSGTVPKGEVFVTAPHKDSFDSRYFGFIRTADIVTKVYPVL